jgi:hypothetical protein
VPFSVAAKLGVAEVVRDRAPPVTVPVTPASAASALAGAATAVTARRERARVALLSRSMTTSFWVEIRMKGRFLYPVVAPAATLDLSTKF